MRVRAEYIWVDGREPTPTLRSKTKVLAKPIEQDELPIWGFDGSSTKQAAGDNSDCVLKPVFSCPDPLRDNGSILVMCEVLNTDMTPHVSNSRAACAKASEEHADFKAQFGLEQEYTFFEGGRPLGWPLGGFPAPQGGYYCGIGGDEVFGREVAEAHLEACMSAGLAISGINAEVMPGQWEFQIGPVGAPDAADQVWLARWLLYRIGEDFRGPLGLPVCATLDPKPVKKGDWNGAGMHCNFSTRQMRESYAPCEAAALALAERHDEHINNYGDGIELRLTGKHETARYDKFTWGVSDRGASVRIPWQVDRDQKGYIEDRRPNANVDPYVLTRLMIETICGAAKKAAV